MEFDKVILKCMCRNKGQEIPYILPRKNTIRWDAQAKYQALFKKKKKIFFLLQCGSNKGRVMLAWGWTSWPDEENRELRCRPWLRESHSHHSEHDREVGTVGIPEYSLSFPRGKCEIGFLLPHHAQRSIASRINLKCGWQAVNFSKQYRKKPLWSGSGKEFFK